MIEKSSLRNRLLKEREQMLPADRKLAEKKISTDLKKILASQKGPLGFYWPFRGNLIRVTLSKIGYRLTLLIQRVCL